MKFLSCENKNIDYELRSNFFFCSLFFTDKTSWGGSEGEGRCSRRHAKSSWGPAEQAHCFDQRKRNCLEQTERGDWGSLLTTTGRGSVKIKGKSYRGNQV